VLFLIPLHALPLEDGSFVCDRFPRGVSYAPSCQLLYLVGQRARPAFDTLFAIQNPTNDLPYTNLEVEVIQSFFSSTHTLSKQAATKLAVRSSKEFSSSHCSHFSCHGKFNATSPLDSALLLADEEKLTLEEIFGLDLTFCRLITLAACEAGLTDATSFSDEYIGLPSGFLYAGSPTVVSSLWETSDLSTSLLMIKFYENLKQLDVQKEGTVASALHQASTWLRNLTSEALEIFLVAYQPQLESTLLGMRPSRRLVFEEVLKMARQRHPFPFANPYYWAVFTATGF
jgi:CHAT domain-containing protein